MTWFNKMSLRFLGETSVRNLQSKGREGLVMTYHSSSLILLLDFTMTLVKAFNLTLSFFIHKMGVIMPTF